MGVTTRGGDRLRVGIISANWGVTAHLPAWRAVKGVDVVAICTAHEETARAAAQANEITRPFWDFEAMAADPEIDLIDCGTRPDLRERMVAAALEGGKHVYNGVPFATEFDGARQLRDLARASGSVTAVDAFAQWLPAHQLMKERIEDGYIGAPHTLSATFDLSLFNRPAAIFPWKWFADPRYGASALRNLGSHALHMMVFLYGPIVEAIGDTRRFLDEWRFDDGQIIRPDVADTATALLRFQNGAMGQLRVGWSVEGAEGWRIAAHGKRGSLVAEHNHFPTARDTRLYGERSTVESWMGHHRGEPLPIPERLRSPPGIAFTVDDAPSQSFPMALAFQDMRRAMAAGGSAAPSFEQAWHVEQVLEAIRRSSLSQRWESCEIE